jgi:replicative DNA helicase Mcm
MNQFDSDLADDFREQPEKMIGHAQEALTQYDVPVPVSFSDAHIRIVELPNTIDIRDIRTRHRGKLIQVQGVIRKATGVRPQITTAAFECQRCGTLTERNQESGDYTEPHECVGCEREGPFILDNERSTFIDSQKIRVQESPEGLRGGETPKSIDVYIKDDITGRVTPGDTVTVAGILQLEQDGGNNKSQSGVFDLSIKGVSVGIEDEEFDELDITDRDISKIKELAQDDEIYDKLASSVAPSIYGFGVEKLAIIFQLFSGVTKTRKDGSRTRGDIHMLLVGDPGTAKSKLLQYVDDIAPRSVYTSGKGASAAGLTASVVRDEFAQGEQWTLEAGALVLADKGVASIDELDKMKQSDQSAMHQALEQQEISISKAGINATLKSRCALLGAANPVMGRFDRFQPIADQIDLSPPLISRFDLIFIVTDTPDEEKDAQLADHILQTNYAGEVYTQSQENGEESPDEDMAQEALEKVTPEVGLELLQKYIAYAQRTCFPVLSGRAKERLEEYYVSLRGEGTKENSPIPVTARKLESLVRIAEASARIRLSETVTEADAERAIDIVDYCLNEIAIDPESGELDADVIESGISQASRDRAKTLIDIIQEIARESESNAAPRDKIIERAKQQGMDKKKVDSEIDTLKEKGEVYEPSRDTYRPT